MTRKFYKNLTWRTCLSGSDFGCECPVKTYKKAERFLVQPLCDKQGAHKRVDDIVHPSAIHVSVRLSATDEVEQFSRFHVAERVENRFGSGKILAGCIAIRHGDTSGTRSQCAFAN